MLFQVEVMQLHTILKTFAQIQADFESLTAGTSQQESFIVIIAVLYSYNIIAQDLVQEVYLFSTIIKVD